jgi:plasmid stabilization system protein ParE
MVDRLTRRSEQIGDFPKSGRKVPEYDAKDIREIIEKPYRIIYRIKPDQIDTQMLENKVKDLSLEKEWKEAQRIVSAL